MNKSVLIGLLVTSGAFLVGLGEWLMLYSPLGGYGLELGHANFLHPSLEQLSLGFYLGVLAAPIYILGYFWLAQVLELSKKMLWLFMTLAVVGFMSGVVWLGTNAYLGLIVHQIQVAPSVGLETILAQIDQLSGGLLQVVRVAVLLLSLMMSYFIFQRDTIYPRFMAFLPPFFLIAGVFMLYYFIPEFGGYLFPAALNVAHFIFFGLSTFIVYKHAKN